MQDFDLSKVQAVAWAKPKLTPALAFIKAMAGKQMLRIMKLTAIILLTACLQVSAKGYSQKITLNLKDAPLQKVFEQVEKQSNYHFVFRWQALKMAKPVNISVQNADIAEVLKICFKDQPLTYAFDEKIVVVKEKAGIAVSSDEALPNAETQTLTGDIRGRVLTKEGEPLSSANVVNKRTGKGTTTDANGNFLLKDVNLDDILVISYTGYSPRSIKVSEFIALTLVMEPAINELDQVVMQAYGQTTQRFNTGNIAKVTAEEISKQPVINPLQALQGRVPGLIISQTSGYGSAPFKVELRGRNNINDRFTSEPLYIIDGVPLTVLELGGANYASGSFGYIQNGSLNPANGQSPLFSLNPNDIESIEVLKDADATAIYGSRAANGVIIITTKKGKAGKSKFDFLIYQGITKVSRYWNMLNTQEYLEMRREAFKNDGITPDPTNAYDLLVWDTTRYTNWQKYLWGGTGKTTDAQLSYSGGNSITQFRVGCGYHRQTDILSVTGSDQRASLSFNIVSNSLNQKFNMSLTGNYSFAKSNMIRIPNAVTLSPNAPSIFDSIGKLNYAGWNPVQYLYPFASLLQPYTSKTNNLISNLYLKYQIYKGLSISANLGYSHAVVNQVDIVPISSLDPATNPQGEARFGNNTIQNWIIEPQAEYNTFINKGKLNVLIGSSIQNNSTEGILTYASGYTNDALIQTPSQAGNTVTTGNYGKYKYSAIFGRINYNWDSKYIVNLSARRDGSSRFGERNQFGNFGAIGVAWILSEESLFKKIKFLSFGKLRGSYGTTGSDAVGDYRYLTQWSASGLRPYTDVPVLQPLLHANPDYHWQVNRKLEAGINLGLFKDVISLSMSWYRNRCDNQLVQYPTPAYTGFTFVTANSPASVENSGLEFGVGANILQLKNFQWTISSNIGINKNKLLRFPNLEQSPYASSFIIGKSLNINRLLHFTGVDPQTGKYTFEDKDKDGTINYSFGPLDDRYIYNLSPKYSGGFGSSIRYKTFELSLFFNFTKQIGINALNITPYPGTISNQPDEVLQRWQKIGDAANRARFTTLGDFTDSYFQVYSDATYTDASYIRLQNISISYSIPKKLIKKARMENLRVYLQGQNLMTITNYKGIDPETQNFGGLPVSKIFTGGIQFNF